MRAPGGNSTATNACSCGRAGLLRDGRKEGGGDMATLNTAAYRGAVAG